MGTKNPVLTLFRNQGSMLDCLILSDLKFILCICMNTFLAAEVICVMCCQIQWLGNSCLWKLLKTQFRELVLVIVPLQPTPGFTFGVGEMVIGRLGTIRLHFSVSSDLCADTLSITLVLLTLCLCIISLYIHLLSPPKPVDAKWSHSQKCTHEFFYWKILNRHLFWSMR